MNFQFRQFDLQLKHPWAIATDLKTGGGRSRHTVLFVDLTDSHGNHGQGETAPAKTYGDSPESVDAFFRQVDPSKLSFHDIPGSLRSLRSITPPSQPALCAIEIALLDGAARIAKQPLHEFLGLPFENGKPLTSVTIGIDTPEKMALKTLEAAAFPVLKLKLGSTADRINFAAVRAAAPNKWFRVDANAAWGPREFALEQIEWLAADGRVEYVEQPMAADTPIEDLLWLHERSPLPLFADESCLIPSDVERCAETFDGVNVKLVKTGGVLGAKETLEAARNRGMKTMIGCMMESSLLITAAAHLSSLADHLDLDSPILITNDPFKGVVNTGGYLHFPDTAPPHGLRVSS